MTIFASGIPTVVSPGVIVGATDFSEFPVGVGVPEGLRSTAPTGTIVYDPGGEENWFSTTGTNPGNLYISNFNDIFDFGEILCRVMIDTPSASGQRVKTSPVGRYWEIPGAGQHFRFSTFSGNVSGAFTFLNPAGNSAGLNFGALPLDSWGWVRMRFTDEGSGNVRLQGHVTFGTDYATPPAVPSVWGIDETVAWEPGELGFPANPGPGGPWGTRLGWLRTSIGPTQSSDRGISFLSFTTDPTFTTPAPVPADVIPEPGVAVSVPSILAVDPLQATYVGIEASPYQIQETGSIPLSVIPGIVSDPAAAACWEYRYSRLQFDEPQQAFQDLSGNGNHLYWGSNRDSIIGDAPGQGGRRGIVGGGENRSLGIPNTDQFMNVGALGEPVRVTLNFTTTLTGTNQIQTILSFEGASGDSAFRFQVGANFSGSLLSVSVTEDGFNQKGGGTGISLTSVFSDYDDMWLRATFNFTADEITIESSVDGVTWDPFDVLAFGAPLASMYQPTADAALWMGSENSGTQNPMQSGAIMYTLIEEDQGAGFVTVQEQDFAAFTELSTLVGSAQQGVGVNASPLDRASHVRIDASNSGRMQTHGLAGAQTTLPQQYDVAPGEIMTIIHVAAVSWIKAGGGAPTNGPIISHKGDIPASSAGWQILSLGTEDGFRFRLSDGATQVESGLALVPPLNYQLAAVVYEIDGVAGEYRSRLGSAGTPVVSAYGNEGGQVNDYGVSIATSGITQNPQDYLGSFLIKRVLTEAEMAEVIDFLSAGRLS